MHEVLDPEMIVPGSYRIEDKKLVLTNEYSKKIVYGRKSGLVPLEDYFYFVEMLVLPDEEQPIKEILMREGLDPKAVEAAIRVKLSKLLNLRSDNL